MMNSHDELAKANALVVRTPSDRQLAADLWSAISGFENDAEKRKEEACRPLKTAWDNARKPFNEFIKECMSAKAKLKTVMSDWDKEQARLSQIEQAKIQAKIDAQNMKLLEKAKAKGVDPHDVVLKAAPVVAEPPKNLTTQDGAVQSSAKRITYGIEGALDNDELTAIDLRVSPLLEKFPTLFKFDWVLFRKIASTGILDNVPGVERREEFSYRRMGGK